MESKLINYSIFIEKRPDMEIHTEVAIVSCINSAYVLLDGECASLISQVDKFNMVDDRSQLDTNHELYRTDFELGQLQEALVFQVQYVLNMGNDFTVGGGSYSIGNINSSYSRPEGRELIAPGVYKLLSNARVYHLNAFGSFSNHNTNEIPLSTSKEIMERVKNEYVAQNQPNAQVGNVAYINQSHQVSFGSPQDLQITTYNTNRIAGPEGYRNNFYEIDSVPNIAFFGPDYNGTYSAVHRQEMIDYVNQNAGESLGQEIAQIKQEQEEQNNKINQNKNLIDSTYEEAIGAVRKNAEQDETIRNQETRIESNWNNINNLNQRVGANSNNIQTNTTNIQTNTNNITALDSRLVSVSGLLTQTIDGLRTLRPFKYVGEYQNGTSYNINQLVSYNNNLYLSKEDNNNTTPPSDKWLLINKDTISVDLSDYPTKLEVEAIKNNLQQSITSNTTNITNLNNEVVKIAGQQIITGKKIFTGPGEGIQIRPNATNGSSYITGYDLDGKIKKWVLGNTGKNEGMLLEAPQGNIYLKPSQNASAKGYIDCYNAKLSRIAVPTANTDAANKQYVDNAIANAAPTDLVNRIQSLETNTVKLTGDQRIEGTKTFTNTSILLGELINIGETQSSLVNKKYVDDAIANAAGTGGAGLENRIQVLENKVDATYGEFIDLANITIPKINQTNQIQQNAINSNEKDITLNRQHIADLQNITTTNRDNIAYLQSHTVTTNTNQTISGQKTFANKILANGGITNLPNPTNTQDATNKQYVDNLISQIPVYNQYNLITSNNGTFNNLQILTIDISRENSLIDKSWMIKFDRMGNNGNKYEGTIYYNFLLPEINQATFAGNSFWYNSTNKRFDTGANAGITILRTNANTLQLTIQCWDGGNRISKIRLYAPK